MSLLWIEGFEGYGTSTATVIDTLLTMRYVNVLSGGNYLTPGRFGGFALKPALATGTPTPFLITPALTTNPTLVVGLAIQWLTTVPNVGFCQLYDGATLGINVQTTAAGEITVYRGATLLGTTSGLGLAMNTWYYIEVKVYCHASAGTVDVHVNGVSKLSLTAQNTKQGTDAFYNQVYIGPPRNTTTALDDVYILDGNGAVNNDFLGTRKVIGLFPASDASVAWTTSAGSTHYNLVNENPEDGDTSYVQSLTSGQADLFGYSGLPPVNTIAGIQINTACKETAAGSHSIITPVKSGSTESDDTAQPVGIESYIDRRRIVETDPATGVAWTRTGLNAAQIGIKVG